MLLTILFGFVAVLVAGALREETVDEARSVRTELEEIKRSLRVMAANNNWEDGREVTIEDLLPEVRGKFKRLHRTKADIYGNPYGPFWIEVLPGVPDRTYDELDGKIGAGYWNPFRKQSDISEDIYREFHSQNDK